MRGAFFFFFNENLILSDALFYSQQPDLRTAKHSHGRNILYHASIVIKVIKVTQRRVNWS